MGKKDEAPTSSTVQTQAVFEGDVVRHVPRLRWLLVVVVVISVVGWLSYRSIRNHQRMNQLKSSFQSLENSRIDPSVNPKDITEVSSLVNARKYAEAKTKIEALLKTEKLNKTDANSLYSQLSASCTALKDVECLQRVITYQKQINSTDIFLLVTVGDMAKEQGRVDVAKALYAEALTEIDKRGGESYIKKLNEHTDEPLDYAQIKASAK